MRYSKEIINNVIKEYESGLNGPELSIKYNLKCGTIMSWVRKYSEPRHRGPQSMIKNEDYFSKIDCPMKAYWLGWIMADGCVSTYANQYSLKIHISIEDRSLIDDFLNSIGSTNKCKEKEYKGNKSYYVSLTSKQMVCDLIRHGVVERKTGQENIPSSVPKEFMNDFIRGFFDGDGITDVVQNRSGFISSKNMLQNIQKEIGSNQKIHVANNSTAFYFLGGIGFSKTLFNYLYDNPKYFLKRKYERLKSISRVNTEITA